MGSGINSGLQRGKNSFTAFFRFWNKVFRHRVSGDDYGDYGDDDDTLFAKVAGEVALAGSRSLPRSVLLFSEWFVSGSKYLWRFRVTG